MIVLIDAFNLIYKFPELEENMARGELESAMSGLLTRLQKLKQVYTKSAAKSKKEKKRSRNLVLHVFFDGKRKRGDETRRIKFSGMDLYYSHDLSADHLIMEFIKRDPTPGDLLVVSTDKKVREFARVHRCQRQTSEEFAEWLETQVSATDAGPEGGSLTSETTMKSSSVPPDEVAYWEEMFQRGSE